MSAPRLAAVILAAGQGKRMNSDLPKVMHKVGGRPMVEFVIERAQGIGADPVIVVIGHGRDLLIPLLEQKNTKYVVQEQQLGTGHAVLCTESQLAGFEGTVLVLAGDVPLLSQATLTAAATLHHEKHASVTIITADAPDPSGYGRILRDSHGAIVGIREHKDASNQERNIKEINSGILLFDARFLFDALRRIGNENAQGEYYLTDVVFQAFDAGRPVAGFVAPYDEIQGVNSLEDLARAETIWQERSGLS
ncbi:MAG: NTP transferase domain-containing protein [bacterium]